MKCKVILLLCFIFLVIGYIGGIILPIDLGIGNMSNEPITKGDYYGNIINIFVAIGTFLAVIVALFKESILQFLNHPKCEVELLENGIIENIDKEQQDPQADSYECVMKINNKGNETAIGCEIFISEVLYSKKKEQDKKLLRDVQGKKKLFWESAYTDIPPRISKEIRLFQIISPNSFGTPNVAENLEKLKIEFNGIQIPLKNSQKGYWEIKYYVSCKNGKSLYFSLNIEWDGSWKNRKSEMNDVLKIKKL